MFFKMVVMDVKNGVLREWKKYLLTAFMFIGFAVVFYFSWMNKIFFEERLILHGNTMGDYVLNVITGMKEFVINNLTNLNEQPFIFPALWLLWISFLAYIVLYYPYNDLMSVGKHILIVSGSKTRWWFSKCIWLVVSCVCYFVVAILSTLFTALMLGAKPTFEITQYMPSLLDYDISNITDSPWDIIPLIFLVFITVLAVCFMQMFLSLILRPLTSFIIIEAFLLLSSYYMNPFLIGNYAMAARSEVFIKNGLQYTQGIIAVLLVIVVSAVSGWIIFKRMDILNKE